MKLKEKYFTNPNTCFLHRNRANKLFYSNQKREKQWLKRAREYEKHRFHTYLAILLPLEVWKPLIKTAVAVPLGYVSLQSMIMIWLTKQSHNEFQQSRPNQQTKMLGLDQTSQTGVSSPCLAHSDPEGRAKTNKTSKK